MDTCEDPTCRGGFTCEACGGHMCADHAGCYDMREPGRTPAYHVGCAPARDARHASPYTAPMVARALAPLALHVRTRRVWRGAHVR
jgi:hypothetical protein